MKLGITEIKEEEIMAVAEATLIGQLLSAMGLGAAGASKIDTKDLANAVGNKINEKWNDFIRDQNSKTAQLEFNTYIKPMLDEYGVPEEDFWKDQSVVLGMKAPESWSDKQVKAAEDWFNKKLDMAIDLRKGLPKPEDFPKETKRNAESHAHEYYGSNAYMHPIEGFGGDPDPDDDKNKNKGPAGTPVPEKKKPQTREMEDQAKRAAEKAKAREFERSRAGTTEEVPESSIQYNKPRVSESTHTKTDHTIPNAEAKFPKKVETTKVLEHAPQENPQSQAAREMRYRAQGSQNELTADQRQRIEDALNPKLKRKDMNAALKNALKTLGVAGIMSSLVEGMRSTMPLAGANAVEEKKEEKKDE